MSSFGWEFLVSTYYDKQYEVDPIPERMSVLYIVHYVNPSFEAYHLTETTGLQ